MPARGHGGYMYTATASRSPRRPVAPKGPRTSKFRHPELSGVLISVDRDAQIYGDKEPADYFYRVISAVIRSYKIHLDGRRQLHPSISQARRLASRAVKSTYSRQMRSPMRK